MIKALKSILSLLVLSLTVGAATPADGVPATYYADYEQGDDGNDGLSADTPFRHIPNSFFASGNATAVTLAPGDAVLLARGCLFGATGAETAEETFLPVIDMHGAEGAPITFGAYNRPGESGQPNPVWNTWTEKIDSPWVDDPTYDLFWTCSASGASRLMLDSILQPMADSTTNVSAGNPWYYDAGTVYLYSPSDNPATDYASIQMLQSRGKAHHGVYADGYLVLLIENSSYISVSNITFRGGHDYGGLINDTNGSTRDITVTDCEFLYFGTTCGIKVSGQHPTVRVTGVEIANVLIDRKLLPEDIPIDAELGGDGVLLQGAVEGAWCHHTEVVDSGHTSFQIQSLPTAASCINNLIEDCTAVRKISNHVRAFAIQEFRLAECSGNTIRRLSGLNMNTHSQLSGANNIVESSIFFTEDHPLGGSNDAGITLRTSSDMKCTGNIVRNNTISNCRESGIRFGAGTTDMGTNHIYNNIVYNSDIGGPAWKYELDYRAPADGATMADQDVHHNLFFNPLKATDDIIWDAPNAAARTVAEMDATYSSWHDNLQVDPLLSVEFPPSDTNHFRIKPGSPAAAAGVLPGALLDFDGNSWHPTTPSMGAFQFLSGTDTGR